MGKKIRTEEVDHLFEAILCLKNQPEAMGKSQGRLAKPRGASEKFWIFPVGFRLVSPA